MKRLWGILLVCMCVAGNAQTTRKIRQLEKQRNELRQQITESETLLKSTQKDVKSQLDNLALLSAQIEERKKYIGTIEADVKAIQLEVDRLRAELKRLQADLKDKREKYERSVRYVYKNKSVQEKLMFIFSADNLSQMYRRLRYVQEYADFQRLQGVQLQRKQKQVTDKRNTLVASRKAKEALLKQGEEEKLKLEKQEKERKTLLAALQKKQKGIQAELNKKRRSANKLNAEIDRLVEIEIEKARKRAEEEARRKAAEAKKAAAADGTALSKKPGKIETYKTDSEDRRLSNIFERNKGILPAPITGPYAVVGHYGRYEVAGLRNVVPEGTRILNVNLTDGTCTVNLSAEFLAVSGSYEAEQNAVRSVVATLCALTGVRRVQLLIGGEPEGLQYYDISAPLVAQQRWSAQ